MSTTSPKTIMQHSLFAAVLISLYCSFASLAGNLSAEAIQGAFGIQLGEVAGQGTIALPNANTLKQNRVVHFKPLKPIEGFNSYSCAITPISHRVYRIDASNVFASHEICEIQAKLVADTFSTTHGKPKIEPIREFGSKIADIRYLFLSKNRSIEVKTGYTSSILGANGFDVSITILDEDLRKLAEAEAATLK